MVRDAKIVGTVAKPERASDRVLTDLRRMILTLELAPGTEVTEAYLAELLNCSRTPLREALQRLAHEHLVVAVPRRGVTIAHLGIVEFGMLADAFKGVDSVIARLAAPRITDQQLTRLAELVALSGAAAKDGDLTEVIELDFLIHTTYGAAAGNRYLLEFQEMILRLLARYIYLGFRRSEDNAAQCVTEHQQILEALRSRDADVVERATREHCEHGRDRMRTAL
jgi:DNA-binding GntR family transcriptional regulator